MYVASGFKSGASEAPIQRSWALGPRLGSIRSGLGALGPRYRAVGPRLGAFGPRLGALGPEAHDL